MTNVNGKEYRILGVITARGKSKGLPGKNLRLLHGKPMIAYTIEAALKSRVVDKLVLTTDDPEIAEVGKKYGAEAPFLRPAYLASDTAHSPDVVMHAAQFVEDNDGYRADYIITFQPTSPLRKPEHIAAGVKKIIETGADSLVGVKAADFPPFWLLEMNEKGRLVPFVKSETDYFCLERQQLPKVYQPNGALFITKCDVLFKDKVLVAKDNAGLEMDGESSLDVDDIFDFKMIEFVMEERERKDKEQRE